jgi:hypothetical protein
LKGFIEEGIEQGELSKDINAEYLCTMVFMGMLGASVLYGTDKSTTQLKRSIDSLIKHLEIHGS